MFPETSLFGGDLNPEAVEGTRKNLKALASSLDIQLADGADIVNRFSPESLSYIVTNPPFGVRLGQEIDYERLYSRLLSGALEVLKPGGRITLLTVKHRSLLSEKLKLNSRFKLIERCLIAFGGIRPEIFVIEKIE